MQTEAGEKIQACAIRPGHEIFLKTFGNTWRLVVSITPDRLDGWLKVGIRSTDGEGVTEITMYESDECQVRESTDYKLEKLRRENYDLMRHVQALNDLFYQAQHIRFDRREYAGKPGYVLHCANPICSAGGEVRVNGRWWCKRCAPHRDTKYAYQLIVGDFIFWDGRIVEVLQVEAVNPSELLISAYDKYGPVKYPVLINEPVDVPTEQERGSWLDTA